MRPAGGESHPRCPLPERRRVNRACDHASWRRTIRAVTDGADPLVALNAVLDEIIDLVREVKDARWRFGASASLHSELDSLFDDARRWARDLVELDEDHGRSPLPSMPTASARQSRDLHADISSEDDVRRQLDDALARLDQHVAIAIASQVDEDLSEALGDIDDDVRRHRQ